MGSIQDLHYWAKRAKELVLGEKHDAANEALWNYFVLLSRENPSRLKKEVTRLHEIGEDISHGLVLERLWDKVQTKQNLITAIESRIEEEGGDKEATQLKYNNNLGEPEMWFPGHISLPEGPTSDLNSWRNAKARMTTWEDALQQERRRLEKRRREHKEEFDRAFAVIYRLEIGEQVLRRFECYGYVPLLPESYAALDRSEGNENKKPLAVGNGPFTEEGYIFRNDNGKRLASLITGILLCTDDGGNFLQEGEGGYIVSDEWQTKDGKYLRKVSDLYEEVHRLDVHFYGASREPESTERAITRLLHKGGCWNRFGPTDKTIGPYIEGAKWWADKIKTCHQVPTKRDERVLLEYKISDEDWESIRPLLPNKAGHFSDGDGYGDERKFIDAVLWVGRSNREWSYLPAIYGRWKEVEDQFKGRSSKFWKHVYGKLGDQNLKGLLIESSEGYTEDTL